MHIAHNSFVQLPAHSAQAVTKDVLKSGHLYQMLAGTEAELSCHYFCLLFSKYILHQSYCPLTFTAETLPYVVRGSSSEVETERASLASGSKTLGRRCCGGGPSHVIGSIRVQEKVFNLYPRCGNSGATIQCQGDGCPKHYHYSCGATAAPEHVFIFSGKFSSFCWDHAPRQQLQQQVAFSLNFQL